MTLTPIFAKVLNMSLTASLVIVLVIAARFLLRKSPKVFSYALWAVVLFRLLCPVSLPSPVSLLGLLDAPVAESDGVTTTVEYISYKVVEKGAVIPKQPSALPQDTTAQAPTQSQQTPVQPQREPLSAAEIITYVWLSCLTIWATQRMWYLHSNGRAFMPVSITTLLWRGNCAKSNAGIQFC